MPSGEGGFPISKSIDGLLTYVDNAYLDECWENRSGSWDKGEAPLQQRVRYLLEELGLNPREVCASNLIFFQSKDAKEIDYALANRCWPIHEAIINLIEPKLILVFGNSRVSPYSYLHSLFGGQEEFFPAGHGDWNLKGFKIRINNRPIYVAGLPHLSRYDPKNKADVIEWLRSKLTSE